MTPPHITVVITAFNEEDFVGQAIESALGQSRGDLEVIVVDDGSTDSTADVVHGYEGDDRLQLIRQENQGLSAARNTGIAAARGELIAFLDADDIWMPEFLERMVEALDRDEKAGFAYADAWWLDDARGRFYRVSAMSRNDPPAVPPSDPEAFLRLLIRANFIFVSTVVRAGVLAEVGGFDTKLRAIEDYDLWIRILAAGHGAAATGRRLAIKRDRGTSMSRQHRNMFVNLRRVLLDAAERDVPEDVAEVARRRAQRLDVAIAALDEEARHPTLKGRAWPHLRAARKLILARRIWHTGTPEAVSRALPGRSWASLGSGA